MGKASRRKGCRVELEIVHALKEQGIDACRVPLSGQHGGKFHGDILVPLNGQDLNFEVKARKEGFKQIYDWIQGHNGLFLKANHKPFLVVQTFDEWVRR